MRLPNERDLLKRLLRDEADTTIEEIRDRLEQARAEVAVFEAKLRRMRERDEDRELDKAMPKRGY